MKKHTLVKVMKVPNSVNLTIPAAVGKQKGSNFIWLPRNKCIGIFMVIFFLIL